MSTLDKISTLLKEQKKTQKDLMDYLGLEKSTFTTWKSPKSKNKSYSSLKMRFDSFDELDIDDIVHNQLKVYHNIIDKIAI